MTKKEEIYKNTQNVIDATLKRAKELGIEDIAVASCSGKTAEYLIGSGLNVVCVTHQVGFNKDNYDEMSQEYKLYLKKNGIKILTTTHLLGGIDRSLRIQFGGVYPAEIVSTTLRLLGQGVKVCVEISVMAADAGLVKVGKDLIAIGGTGIGADTSIVISPQHSQNFFKTKVREIISKPFDL
ncbi:pyruvate kinase alpha/beta domain-containing protein [Actinomycetota bacterium]